MKYILKFWDKSEVLVSEAAWLQIMKEKHNGTSSIIVGKALYELKAIYAIEPVKDDRPANDFAQIEGGMEINRTVKKETLDKVKAEMAKKFGWK
jgi:hypothetical protein